MLRKKRPSSRCTQFLWPCVARGLAKGHQHGVLLQDRMNIVDSWRKTLRTRSPMCVIRVHTLTETASYQQRRERQKWHSWSDVPRRCDVCGRCVICVKGVQCREVWRMCDVLGRGDVAGRKGDVWRMHDVGERCDVGGRVMCEEGVMGGRCGV